jgi:hypothetical protein
MLGINKRLNLQSGQTLIETIIAIFVLTTALVSSLALVIYVLSNSGLNQNQIIATNLAREGVEIMRKRRDSNWLADDKMGGVYDLAPCPDIENKNCFPKAHELVVGTNAPPSYDLSSAMDGSHALKFNPNSGFSVLTGSNYRLCQHKTGYYGTQAGGKDCNGNDIIPTNYYRSIEIDHIEGGNFPATDANSNTELVIKSIVGWTDKKCPKPPGNDPDPAIFQCKIVVEEHLTNWKDYK